MSSQPHQALLDTLQSRFETHMNRHPGIEWAAVQARLAAHPEKITSLQAMENSGGEPDVIGYDRRSGKYLFCDCAPQSPAGRRNGCYDREAQLSRKVAPPPTNALDMAAEMGIELLDEAQYRELQNLGEFDTTTSSWLRTPPAIRKLGGAIFGDRRYNTVFIYHNGAQSYYSARGFRGLLRV